MAVVPLGVTSYRLLRVTFGSHLKMSRTIMAQCKRSSVSTSSTNLKASREKDKEPENDTNASKETTNSKFLLKSEPSEFSIENLRDNCADQSSEWDGIRNYEARNNLLSMSKGHQCFFYHSSCKIPGIVGIVNIVREAQTDLTALDPEHENYDPKCQDEATCPWESVKVKLDRVFPHVITLQQLKETAKEHPSNPIAQMTLLSRSRLSVSKVTDEQWNAVLEFVDSSEV